MDLYSSTKAASRSSSARVWSAALAGSEKSKAVKFNNRKARASNTFSRSHCARCFNRSQPASSNPGDLSGLVKFAAGTYPPNCSCAQRFAPAHHPTFRNISERQGLFATECRRSVVRFVDRNHQTHFCQSLPTSYQTAACRPASIAQGSLLAAPNASRTWFRCAANGRCRLFFRAA